MPTLRVLYGTKKFFRKTFSPGLANADTSLTLGKQICRLEPPKAALRNRLEPFVRVNVERSRWRRLAHDGNGYRATGPAPLA